MKPWEIAYPILLLAFAAGCSIEYPKIITAMEKGDLERFKRELRKEEDINTLKYGISLLQTASAFGHLEMAEILLENGADVNQADLGGTTPLEDAAINGHLDIVNLLIAKGASVVQQSPKGYTALHAAAYGGNPEIVKVLLENGAEIDARDEFGMTPLHNAARSGQVAAARFLLENGADINTMDYAGETALHGACSNASTDNYRNKKYNNDYAITQMIRVLLNHGADPDLHNIYGESPLEHASRRTNAYQGKEKTVQLLREYAARIREKDHDSISGNPCTVVVDAQFFEVQKADLEWLKAPAGPWQSIWSPSPDTMNGFNELLQCRKEVAVEGAARLSIQNGDNAQISLSENRSDAILESTASSPLILEVTPIIRDDRIRLDLQTQNSGIGPEDSKSEIKTSTILDNGGRNFIVYKIGCGEIDNYGLLSIHADIISERQFH